jgi:hypothetical protein
MRPEDGPEQEVGEVKQIALADRATVSLKAEKDGKISVGISTCSDTLKVLPGEVLEVRHVRGQVRIAKKVRRHDEKDPYVPPYDCYGPDNGPKALDPTAEPTQPPAAVPAVPAEGASGETTPAPTTTQAT